MNVEKRILQNKTWVLALTCLFAISLFCADSKLVKAGEGDSYYIMLLVDQSGSITGENSNKPTGDPDNKRIRFAHFLIQYMNSFFPEQVEIGLTAFIARPQVIFPMRPVAQWANMNIPELLDSVTQEGNTRYKPVLDVAEDAFTEIPCQEINTNCYVVLLTDDTITTEGVLTDFSQQDINFLVVSLSGDETEIPENVKTFWENAGGVLLCQDGELTCNANQLENPALYQKIIEYIGLDDPFETLVVTSFDDAEAFRVPILPFRKYTRQFLFADGPITPVWNPSPNFQTSTEYLWLDPPPGEIEAALQISSVLTPTLLFSLPSESAPYPVLLETQIQPSVQQVGLPVKLQGHVVVNDVYLTKPDVHRFYAVDEKGKEYELAQEEDGWFRAILPAAEAGEYTLTFQVELSPTLELAPVEGVSQTYRAGRLPSLHLSIEGLQAHKEAGALDVTIQIENYEVIQPVVPTLTVLGLSNSVSLIDVGNGEFKGKVSVPSHADLTLQASLPAGTTRDGLAYAELVVEGRAATAFKTETVIERVFTTIEVVVPPARGRYVLLVVIVGFLSGWGGWVLYKRSSQRAEKLENMLGDIVDEHDIDNYIQRQKLKSDETAWQGHKTGGKRIAEHFASTRNQA